MKAERERDSLATMSVKEAAFVAGLSEKAVYQAIERKHIRSYRLGGRSGRKRPGLRLSEAAYLRVSRVLAPDLRSDLYSAMRDRSWAELPREFRAEDVRLDLSAALDEVRERVDTLQRLAERIEIDPEVRGGEPVFRGTRVPVYTIARKTELGADAAELMEDYPALEEADIGLARMYAELYPPQGRPRAWTADLQRTRRK